MSTPPPDVPSVGAPGSNDPAADAAAASTTGAALSATTPVTDPGSPHASPDPEPAAPDAADAVAAAVLAVPGVAALHAGMFGEVGTYLPGRRISGIRLDNEAVQVHVVLSYGASITSTADSIRAAVMAVTGQRRVDVHIEDLIPLSPAGTTSTPAVPGPTLSKDTPR